MEVLKRASLYCVRQKFKTAVLFLVLTITASFILTGIAIRDASVRAEANVQKAIGGRIVIDIDMNGHMTETERDAQGSASVYNGDYITDDMVKAIMKVKGVVDTNAEEDGAYWGAAVNFKYIVTEYDFGSTQYGDIAPYTSTISSAKCKAFMSGKYRLVSGRHLNSNDKYACLVSKQLADLNKLKTGDKIKLYSMDLNKITEFEIVGIFDGTEGSKSESFVWDIPANKGFAASGGLRDLFKDFDCDDGYVQLSVFAEDPVSIEKVRDRIAALPELKDKTFKYTIDTDEYNAVSTPLGSLQDMINTAIIIISVVSVVILSLLLTIRIRGRKKEIGILLSLGKSKFGIVSQIFTETILVAVFAFGAAIPLSMITADKAGRFIASRTAGAPDLNVSIDTKLFLPMCLTGILLTVIAVTASSWTVVRSRPKDILTKMS